MLGDVRGLFADTAAIAQSLKRCQGGPRAVIFLRKWRRNRLTTLNEGESLMLPVTVAGSAMLLILERTLGSS